MTPGIQETCLAALTESASEVAATVLGGVPFEASDTNTGCGVGYGAYLGLVAQEEPVQVALVLDAPGCQALAKALLGMEPGDEDLPASDMADAMCEIINIVAGGLKRRLNGSLAITMGLPIFVAGPPLPNHQQQLAARALKIAGADVSLLLLTQRQSAMASHTGVTLHKMGNLPAKEESA